jgi:V/A-type H+-transporting ATPase subunit E
MSYRELIEALNRECEEKLQQIRQEAECDAGKFREEVLKKVCELKDRCGREQSAAVKAQREAILSRAVDTARTNRLRAEEALSGRLHGLAVRSLVTLRNEHYREVLSSLVAELPPGPWEVVKVNPEDRELARTLLPGAEVIEATPGITGGVEAEGRNGSFRVVNTFEKRLERVWPEMLPEIIKDVYRDLSA